MITTERASVMIPKPALAEARERWPELRDASGGRILRYALALALGKSHAEALAFTRDARIGTTRKPQSERQT